MEILEGVLERVTFYSEETSYLVGQLGRPGKDNITFVGHFPLLREGESLRLKGEWKIHPRYGKQFQVKEWETLVPATLKGIERFIASGVIKGVGPSLARVLVKHFGLETLEIMESSPERLVEVNGIGPKKAAQIHESYLRHRELKEVMLFLQNYSVTPSLAAKIYKKYGNSTIAVLRENPYQMAEDVYGVGFITADKIARKMGLSSDSPHRIRSAVLFVLSSASDEGHVFLPLKELCKRVKELICREDEENEKVSADEQGTSTGSTAAQISEEDITEQVDKLSAENLVVCQRDYKGEKIVYTAPLYYAEKGSALKMLSLLNRQQVLSGAQDEKLFKEALQEEELELAPEQIDAVKGAYQNGVMVITGGPGTGKTTIIRVLINLFKRSGQKVMLAAPTGRAAKRMTEATGMEAKTIHRLLEYTFVEGEGFKFQRGEKNPLSAQVLIIDESSMIDLILFYNLLKAVPQECKLVLVGDVDQLPSVGSGNVLKDLIDSGVIPCVKLEKIFRQARQSMIVVNAHRVNSGKFPLTNHREKDFFFIQEEDVQRVMQVIIQLCKERLPSFGGFDPLEEIQVLTPMRKTPVGVEMLNYYLQEELNPGANHKKEITSGGTAYRLGDKVMQIRNNYEKEVFNGDIGRISGIDLEEGELVVSFPDISGTREVIYDSTELDELVLSYAISVHKSQGSEYPVVVMPVVTQHFILLQRNLLYTAITRARRLVVLVGTHKAVGIAVNNNRVENRYTNLAQRLMELQVE